MNEIDRLSFDLLRLVYVIQAAVFAAALSPIEEAADACRWCWPERAAEPPFNWRSITPWGL